MEDNYKLEEVHGINFFSYKLKKYIFILWLISSIIFLKMCITGNSGYSITVNIFVALFCITILGLFLGAIILTIHWFPQYNKEYKKIKNIGEKKEAYIVDTGYTIHGRTCEKYFYIDILYKEDLKKIYRMEVNKAYKLLEVLFDSRAYPVKREIIKIPIDIYVYKNKIYADLESVCLSTVPGYDEAKKAVNEVEASYYKSEF